MRAKTLLLLLALPGVLLLAGCGGVPLTEGEARATAEVCACWPYGARQPLPATPRPPSATPRLQVPAGTPTATPAPPAASATPWVVYATCTPAPLTPTVTPMPTATPRPWVAPTPQPPAAISAAQELQDANGVVGERGISWAYNPRADGPVIAWVAFGWRADAGTDGQVWVTSRGAYGAWRQPQSVNVAPVVKNWGGVAVAAAPTGALRLIYATGDPKTVSTVYEVRSDDDGQTWSLPEEIARGGAQALRADSAGGWHALIIGPAPFDSQLSYGYAPANGSWQWTPIPGEARAYRADMALLDMGGQITREIVSVRTGTEDLPRAYAHLYHSDDGQHWAQATQAPLSPLALHYPTIRPQIIAIPRGDGLVAAAWSTYGRGMVVASISTDGGRSFGPEEVIAQHSPDGTISEEFNYGIEPTLAYDPESDALVASWNEIATGAGITYPWPARSFLAWRPLDRPLGQPWLDAVTPDTIAQPRTALDLQRRTFLFATPDGAHAGLIIIDERNYQWRVSTRDVHLPALTTHGES
ncbi:exo-alpha-sialidase [Chloroflexales bacterium ZM16-3]|nr:exo-alpha-sialidase [Chloroflexales bacterium ZM16-3]